MLKLDAAGYDIILTVHDEIVLEMPCHQGGKSAVKSVCDLMCDVPVWAEGLPIFADGWREERYKK
jgi:DNA polymerase